jgi:hypothetical protein
MNVFQKILAFLKKIGVLSVGGTSSTYTKSTDAGYQPPMPDDN